MAECDECGDYENLPYQCHRCGQTFCSEHRLPENHDCPGLNDWNDPSGVFDSGFDDSVDNPGRTSTASLLDRLTGTGGPLGYFRNNLAYTFLAVMWVVFLLEFVVIFSFDNQVFFDVFVLSSAHIEYVWTWFTSIFAHSPNGFMHIVGNSIVLFFFGPIVERYIGSKKFALLFVGSGVAAGLAQVFTGLALGDPTRVLGASGAIFAILGVLTVLRPDMRILLFFLVPIPLWLFTLGFSLLSVVFFLNSGVAAAAGQSNVAHFAHLIGVVIGLAYGRRVKQRLRSRVPEQLRLGGGRRGPF